MGSKQHSVEWKLKVGTEGGQEITALQRDLKTLGTIDSFVKLKKQTQDAEAAWRAATVKVSDLAKGLKSTEAPTKKMAADFERAKKQAAALKDQFEKTRLATNVQRKALFDAGISTTNLSKAQADLKKRLEETGRAAQESAARTKSSLQAAAQGSATAASGMGKVAAAGSGLPPIIGGISSAVGGLAAGYLTLNSGVTVLREIAAATLRAETSTYNLQASVAAANKEFSSIGSAYLWEQAIRDLGEELKVYTDSELRNAVARAVDMTKRLGLSFDEMREVVRRAADLGAGKTTLEDSVERVTAALRGEAEASEYLGLTLNENYVKAQYEASEATGKLWKDLTDVEKALVRYRILLEQSDSQTGRAAGTVNTLSGAWTEAKANMENYVARSDTTKRASENLAVLVKGAGDIAPAFAEAVIALSEGQGPISAIIAGYREATGAATESATAFSATGESLRKLREMDALYTAQYEGDAAAESKALAADVADWKAQKWEDILKSAKTALDAALKEEQKYSEQVKELAKDRADAQKTTEQLIRDLMRTTMSEGDAYNDRLAQARETMSQASKALAQGDAAAAKALYEEAQRQFAQLGREVKDGETVIVSSAEAVSNAMGGVRSAGQGIQDALKAMQDEAQANQDAASASAQQIKDDIQSIKDAHKDIEVMETTLTAKDMASKTIAEIKDRLEAIKDKTVTIKVKYDEGPRPKGLATGGRVPGYAFGGRLPGYSLTDNMMGMIRGKQPIALAGGEDVTNALSSRVIYGAAPWLMPALNRVRTTADLSKLLAKIKNMQGLAGGGRVSESYRVTLAAGNSETTMTTQSRAEYDGLKAFTRTLNKHKLVHGS